ncbi:MAG: CatA-like O-acetyltransferase [Proteobacteria bacterium]|nr:CatA-like O-acetyltransferase [Pseudomonadota bacterium]
MKVIDLNSWQHRGQYKLFRSFASPHLSTTVRIDVTEFREIALKKELSLFRSVLYAIMTTANQIPELRTRFSGDKIYEHAIVHPSYTVPISDESFAFCETKFVSDWNEFDRLCKIQTDQAVKQSELTPDATKDEDHWIYLSCAPWLDFTATHHPVPNADDCIPRIAWGKITEEMGKWRMAVNLQVHHALVDGLHVARFYQGLESNLKNF